jgi:hypothetical protein
MPPLGFDTLRHIVVLMMENRSFDHMLGSLKSVDARIDGLDGSQSNPDTSGGTAPVLPQVDFQGQLDPDPDHHFPGGFAALQWRYHAEPRGDHARFREELLQPAA